MFEDINVEREQDRDVEEYFNERYGREDRGGYEDLSRIQDDLLEERERVDRESDPRKYDLVDRTLDFVREVKSIYVNDYGDSVPVGGGRVKFDSLPTERPLTSLHDKAVKLGIESAMSVEAMNLLESPDDPSATEVSLILDEIKSVSEQNPDDHATMEFIEGSIPKVTFDSSGVRGLSQVEVTEQGTIPKASGKGLSRVQVRDTIRTFEKRILRLYEERDKLEDKVGPEVDERLSGLDELIDRCEKTLGELRVRDANIETVSRWEKFRKWSGRVGTGLRFSAIAGVLAFVIIKMRGSIAGIGEGVVDVVKATVDTLKTAIPAMKQIFDLVGNAAKFGGKVFEFAAEHVWLMLMVLALVMYRKHGKRSLR